jgi:hypothetical protein
MILCLEHSGTVIIGECYCNISKNILFTANVQEFAEYLREY